MIILDTNVISALMRDRPDEQVATWLDSQPGASIWTTAINVFEIRCGLLSMPAGKRQVLLLEAFASVLEVTIQGRIALFDLAAAQAAAELEAAGLKKGRPREARDTMIAGIVVSSHATLATRNIKHFYDIASSVVSPWES